MKRRKILVLIPMLGLFLSGCTFQEGFATAKSWIGEHIYHPVKDWIEDITGKKDEPTPEPKPTPDPGPGPGPGPSPVEVDYGSLEQPLTLAEFQTNVEKVIDYSSVEEGKTVTHTDAPFFIKGEVSSNTAINNGQIQFTNLGSGADAVTGFKLSFDEAVDSAKYGVANAMVGSEIVIKGYGMIFKKMVNQQPTKVIEIGNQSDDGEKGKILSVTPPAPTPGTNYGTAEAPLTTSQAHTLLDGENPSKAAMFVTGTVKSNTVWSTEYKNVDIVITDGAKDFTIFRTSKFPSGIVKEEIAENSLVGKTVVATGTGKIYTPKEEPTTPIYEFESGCEVLSVINPAPTKVTITSDTEMIVGGQLQLEATVDPEAASQEVDWTIVAGDTTAEGAEISEQNVLTVTSAGVVVVKATAKGTEVSDTATITATVPSKVLVEEIVADPTSIEMRMGDAPVTITATVTPSNVEEKVTWEILSGDDVISLDETNHTVTAVAPGEASVRIQGEDSHNGVTIPVTVKYELKTLEEAYTLATASTPPADPICFRGTVVGTDGNYFYIQNGEYGMFVRPTNNISGKDDLIEGVAVGKIVEVVAKVTQFHGLVETANGGFVSAEVVGDAPAMPEAVNVTSKAQLASLKTNVLVSFEATLVNKTTYTWSTTSFVRPTFTIGTDTEAADAVTITLEKAAFTEEQGAAFNTASVGAKFTFTNVISAAYDAPQCTFVEQSTLVKAFVAPTSVTVTGLNSVVEEGNITLSAQVEPAGASQAVVWSVTEGTEHASVDENGVVNGLSEGTATIRATAVDYPDVFDEKEITVTAKGEVVKEFSILPTDGTAAESQDFSIVKNGVTVSVTASTLTSEQIRVFKGQTITITSQSKIASITFTCTANGTTKYGPGCFGTLAGYTFEASGKTGTWTGSALSVALTAESNQVRITEIAIVLE